MANPLPNRTEELPDRKFYDPDSEENWADPLEAVIEEVSANSIVSGTSRSNFDPLDGQLFIPTTGGDWFIGNGTAWENLGPIGDIGNHVADTTNPHSVTAAQADALPTSGGTVTGDTTFTNTTHDSIGTAESHISSQLDIPIYSDDTNAPAETHFFNDTDGALKYKDASGTVHAPSGAGDTISVQNQTGEVFAREFSGADLSAKVQNALSSLAGGYGRVRITPKADGTAWSWDSDLTIDTTNYNGLELDFDQTVEIDYTGSGWAITLDGVGGATDTQARITGGVWTNSGDPAGWLRIQDCFGTVVRPTEVEMRNSTTDAVGVSIQNVDSWSESTRVSGTYRADIGIDTVPASITGGTGTESFHDTYLDNPKINAYSIGIRMRGYFDYCYLAKPVVWPKADGVSAYVLGASRMDGTTFVSLKAESSGGTNHIGIETVSGFEGFYYGPTIIGGRFDISGQQFANNGGVAGAAPFIRTWQREFKVDDLTGNNGANLLAEGNLRGENLELLSDYASISGHSLNLENGGTTFLDSHGGVINYAAYDPQDVRGMSASKGYVAYHDPSISGDSNTEGPAFYNGSAWISQVDGSTIS